MASEEVINIFCHSNRMLIMNDCFINIWCLCMSLILANVFEDDNNKVKKVIFI